MKQHLTLQEMAAELERQEAVKVDYVADTTRMHFATADAPNGDGTATVSLSELDLLGEDGAGDVGGLKVLRHAHHQIANRLGIPWKFYERLQGELPVLLDENVNRLFRHRPERRMVRTLDGNARAFLSDSYRRLDNAELARVLIPILGDIPDVQFRSCALTDERLYIKATAPRVTGQVKVGEEVCAGVFISNSEVGSGSFRVEPFVETLACTNGMVIPKALGAESLRRIHVGRRVENVEASMAVFRDETLQADDRAFFMAAADVVRAAVDEVRFRELVEVMQAAAEDRPVQHVARAVEVLGKSEQLSEGEQENVLQHLAAGGDLTRWGVLSAVTRTAEDVDSYDRATELEELGGKLLTYSDSDWRALANA
jgi:hypothetical protein